MAQCLAALLVVICLSVLDVVVCPPVTEKPPSSTPAPDKEEDVVCTVSALR